MVAKPKSLKQKKEQIARLLSNPRFKDHVGSTVGALLKERNATKEFAKDLLEKKGLRKRIGFENLQALLKHEKAENLEETYLDFISATGKAALEECER